MPPLSPIEARVLGSLVEKQIATPDYYPLSLNALVNACNQKNHRDPVVTYDESTVLRALESLRLKNLAYVFAGAAERVRKYGHTFPKTLHLDPAETALLCVLLLRGPQTPGELRSRTPHLHNFENLAAVEATLDRLATRQPGTAPASDVPGLVSKSADFDLADVEQTLDRLELSAPKSSPSEFSSQENSPSEALAKGAAPTTRSALIRKLPRTPGTKEARYTHLLGTEPTAETSATEISPSEFSAEENSPSVALAKEDEAHSHDRLAHLEAEISQLKSQLTALQSQFATFQKQFE